MSRQSRGGTAPGPGDEMMAARKSLAGWQCLQVLKLREFWCFDANAFSCLRDGARMGVSDSAFFSVSQTSPILSSNGDSWFRQLVDETAIQCFSKMPTVPFTLWLFNIAMENSPFIDDFPIRTSIYKGFSMAMLNNQMV